MKCPPTTNRFRLYAVHRRPGGGDFCGPGRDAGSDRDAFSAPTRILTVILWVGAGMRGLLELLLLVKRRGAQAHTAACGLHAGLISCFLRS